jgi:hypothetical protein
MTNPRDVTILDIQARPRVQVIVQQGGVLIQVDETDSVLIDIQDVEAVSDGLGRAFVTWNKIAAGENVDGNFAP